MPKLGTPWPGAKGPQPMAQKEPQKKQSQNKSQMTVRNQHRQAPCGRTTKPVSLKPVMDRGTPPSLAALSTRLWRDLSPRSCFAFLVKFCWPWIGLVPVLYFIRIFPFSPILLYSARIRSPPLYCLFCFACLCLACHVSFCFGSLHSPPRCQTRHRM